MISADISFTHDGALFIAMEHVGEESFSNINSFTSEIGLGAVSPEGKIIDIAIHTGFVLWLDRTGTDREELPRITILPTGEFYIAYSGFEKITNKYAVIIQGFNADASFMDSPFVPYAESSADVNSKNVDIAANGNISIAVWQDGRDDDNWDIYGQFFSSTNTIGNNIRINKNDVAGTVNFLPSVTRNTLGERIVVWLDNRLGKDYSDVYVKVIGTIVTFVSGNKNNLPVEYSLSKNFPNPFNPNTTIKYSIKLPPLAKGRTGLGSLVTLKVYDVLGKEVATLVNENKKPGSYELNFNANQLASGIYFYRLAIHSDKLQISDYVEIKKCY